MKLSKKAIYLITSIFFIISVACSEEDEKSSEEPNKNPSEVRHLKDKDADAVKEMNLTGAWTGVCLNFKSISKGSIYKFNQSNSIWEQVILTYGKQGCESSEILMTQSFKGTYEITDTDTNLQEGKNIDFYISEVNITLQNELIVKDFNTREEFEYSDWEVGVEKDVMNRIYKSNGNNESFTPGYLYNIIKLEGDYIQFGSEAKKESERPAEWNKYQIYKLYKSS